MKESIELVRPFMVAARQNIPNKPTIPTERVMKLRCQLHLEEACTELWEGFADHNIVKVFDSVCDSLVVVFGTALACGFTPEQVEAGFREVMRSNMTKFIDGTFREDGKYMKGPSYSPANLKPIIEQ